MLSNKLTFSLASLIVLFALIFATTPVMAGSWWTDSNDYRILGRKTDPNDATSATYVPTRADFRVKIKITFSRRQFLGLMGPNIQPLEVKAAISPSPLYTTDVTGDS